MHPTKTQPEAAQHLCLVIHGHEDVVQVGRSKLVGAIASQLTGTQLDVNTASFPLDAVELAVVEPSRTCTQRMPLTKLAWETLLEKGEMHVLERDIRHGALLEPAVAAQLEIVQNFYEHTACNTSWRDTWSCGCDDECPHCGTSISPVETRAERTLVMDHRGIWDLVTSVKHEHTMKMTMDMDPEAAPDEEEPIRPRMRM